MNPLFAAMAAVFANLVAALLAWRVTRGEARTIVLVGAGAAVAAAGLCALPLLIEGEEVALAIGGFALRADTLVGTLLLPIGLASGAMALAMPRSTVRPDVLAATALAVSGSILALVADDVLMLAGAETLGALAVGVALARDHYKAGVGYLAASAMFLTGGVALASIQGTAAVPFGSGHPQSLGVAVLFLFGALLRVGAAPTQSGLTASLQGAPTSSAVLLAAPIGGIAVLVRVVQPALSAIPESTLLSVGLLALSALAALVAVSANDLGRSTAWVLAALNGMVVAGIIEASPTGSLGAELLWAALVLSEVGYVLVMSMVTRRLGPVDTRRLNGMQGAAPALSLVFLLVSLTIAGVPGTLEFVAHDVLLSGSSHVGLAGIVLTVITIATVGFNAMRLYFSVFYGAPDPSSVDMDIRGRERFAILVLVGLVLAGGVAPSLLPLVARAAHAAGG